MWRRFFYLYATGGMLAIFWVTLESIYIKNLSFLFLLQFSLPANFVMLIVLVIVMLGFTFLRLGIGRQSKVPPNEQRIRLLRFPIEVYSFIIFFGALIIPSYHLIHYLTYGHSLTDIPEVLMMNFIRSYLYELSIFLSIAVFYYALARRMIRPLLVQINSDKNTQITYKSFIRILAATFSSLLLMTVLMILWYVLEREAQQQPIDLWHLGGLVTLNLFFSMGIFLLLGGEYRKDLHVMIRELQTLSSANKASLKLPILSNDETGMLALFINKLHDRISDEYTQLQDQLELARKVQIQILPLLDKPVVHYKVDALSIPRKNIGSGFYDVIAMKDDHYAFVIGEVAEDGLPGALRMSAALVALRAELRSAGSIDNIVSRTHHALTSQSHGEGLSLALVIFEPSQGRIQYALTGQTRGQVISPTGVRALQHVEDLAEVNQNIQIDQHQMYVEAHERLILYTTAFEPLINSWTHIEISNNIKFAPLREWVIEEQQAQSEKCSDYTFLTVQLHEAVRRDGK